MSKCEQCIVREFSALKALTKDELVRMADCKKTRDVAKGETIFREGERLGGIFCVKDGVCKMTKLSSSGKQQIVKLIRRGELLGQRSLISEEPANLSAVAIADMQVCFIPKHEILEFFSHNPKFAMNFTKVICGDLKEADDILVGMAQLTVKGRLARILVYLADTFGLDDENGLKIQLSREEIASMAGTATESCIRLLSEFAKSGLIALRGKKIIILDQGGLKNLS
jgi:CRP/FNR family transcriptional regulator, polysaccharide utilization system transcription regulator